MLKVEKIINTPVTHIILGFESSGKVHLGHYMILREIKKAVQLDPTIKVTLLVSDIHAFLNFKDNIDENTKLVVNLLSKLIPCARIVKSSDLIKDPLYWKYYLNFLKTVNFKQFVSGLPMERKKEHIDQILKLPGSFFCYSAMQSIDHLYLQADTIYAGVDQRNIYMMGYDKYEKMGYSKPNYVFYPLLTMNGLSQDLTKKMSSSKVNVALDEKLLQTVSSTRDSILNYCITEEVLQNLNSTRDSFLTDLKRDLLLIL